MSSSLRKSSLHERNVVRHLYKTSIYGKPNRVTPLSQDMHFVLEKLGTYKDNEVRSLYIAVRKLDEVLKPSRPIKSEAFKAFWNIKQLIIEMGKREENERFAKTNESVKWIKNQVLLDLIKILHKFVLSYTVFPFKVSHIHEKGEILQLRGVAFELIHETFVFFEQLIFHYCEDHSFLVCLFTHLQFLETCFPACRVLECLLLARKKILDLSSIDYLKEMVVCFGEIALGNFCKILAVTLSELDMYEHKTSLYAQTKQKKSQNFYIRDINQDVVLKIPKILPRLVNIACAKPYVPWFPCATMESEQWLKWIDNQCAEERNATNVTQFIGGITEWNKSGICGPNMSSIKISSELTFRADAVCVLGLLLVGRHRKEVQKELADLQLIPRLSDLFDHFIWRSNTRRDHTRLPGHNSSCECSPEVALKIQVLRLIHSFCDHSEWHYVCCRLVKKCYVVRSYRLFWNHFSQVFPVWNNQNYGMGKTSDTSPRKCRGIELLLLRSTHFQKDIATIAGVLSSVSRQHQNTICRLKSSGNTSSLNYKHVMLSWNEYSELKTLEGPSASSSAQPSWISRESMCTGVKGFLSKIVEVMKKESGASTFRFWLSRAIESYLRGSYSGADQDFLLRRNLLQHVVGNLITSNIRHKEVLQSSFDLLGELIRFNTNAFRELNSHLCTVARQRKLLSLMNGSLVDSNMFIRSLILSYECFMSSDNADLKQFAQVRCFLLSHVSTLNVRVHYLQKLLSLINIHNLTQENVSCLNTALVILMFALRKAELPQYLQILASNQEGCSVATSDQSGLMDNLKDLLIFWQDHYLQKDKDCTILERSSRIPFQEWKDTVTLLTSDAFQNPNAIAYYTMPAVSSRAS